MSPSRDQLPAFRLPPVPTDLAGMGVAAWREPVSIDTYLPATPDPYPAYLDRRVYQGSSGRVYPLPCQERIATTSAPRQWDAVHLENQWIRLMILPELGGRIHVGYDKVRGYDFFYRNNVIKPGLVGLAGPWIAGGVEFNWPQHHRPGTFLPVDVAIEHEPDGAVTVWCSDHDPLTRMKGAHGVRLRPDRAVVELRVRLYNRSEDVRTFLWWANVAVRVHDNYQSFFPTDVHHVADHAKRAVASFPRVAGRYYGVDYPARVTPADPDADRLDWWRNIPVPTSYMCVGSEDDFFGGYDHTAQAGFLHVADHRIAPGKKQWTWGNAPFGQAWERHLTDHDGPYIELMAGVYTDNQPDFSFLAPAETKVFSQFWYPFGLIGPVHQANLDAAVSLHLLPDTGTNTTSAGPDTTDAGTDTTDAGTRAGTGTGAGTTRARVGVATTAARPGSVVMLRDAAGRVVWQTEVDLSPESPLLTDVELSGTPQRHDLEISVVHQGATLLRWRQQPPTTAEKVIQPATAPPAPDQIGSADELYLTGLHLAQYRHATRSPEPYWQEALRRDPGDARCNVALAARHYDRGEYGRAEWLLRRAVRRLTTRNPNPYDGEAHYRLGLTLLRLQRPDDAYDALAKAAWNAAWRTPAYLAMARLDCRAGRWTDALAHLDLALVTDAHALQARDLRVLVLLKLGRDEEAVAYLEATLAMDPLDWWARDIAGLPLECDAQTCLDVALDYAAAGLVDDALRLLDIAGHAVAAEQRASENHKAGHGGAATVRPGSGLAPLLAYHRAALLAEKGDAAGAAAAAAAAHSSGDASSEGAYCFPSRLEDAAVLAAGLDRDPADARAAALLGHWLYAKGRAEEAIGSWRRSVELDPADAVVWRNLGVAAYNVHGDADEAVACYRRAAELAPADARLCYERDQLAKRLGSTPTERLSALAERPELVAERDDLTVEYVELLVATGAADQAMGVLAERHFQPWEGGEGLVLAAWERASLALARAALAEHRPDGAERLVLAALDPPVNLGETRHPLANAAELLVVLGDARAALGDPDGAHRAWTAAAASGGDFQQMSVMEFSESSCWRVRALRRLGEHTAAERLIADFASHLDQARATPATIDYFATSLPTMLLFTEDVQRVHDDRIARLTAQLIALRAEPVTPAPPPVRAATPANREPSQQK